MHLDLLIPTFQRPALLRAALTSVGRTTPPRAMTVAVTVINNDTEPLVLEPEFFNAPYPLRVLHERRRGKSAALNAGIAASTADYVGLIDDDEEVAADWFLVIERALETGQLDFIGGRATGTPAVTGARVVGVVEGESRGPKIRVFKKKRRKGMRRTKGHRSTFTLIRITEIQA